MNKRFLFFLFFLFHTLSIFSQINDSNQILSVGDSIRLDIIESRFSDSIALLNHQNEQLRESRDAYNSGLLLLDSKNYIDASAYFTNAIKLDSIFSEAYYSRGRCYHMLNNELAISDYLKAFQLDSSRLTPLYSLASFQFTFDKELAKETYNRIIFLDKEADKAFAQLGVIAFLDKDYEKSEKFFTQSLSINKTAYTLNDRGSSYRVLERFDLAIDDYLAAIDLNPDLAFVYNNLASVYVKIGKGDKALLYYNLAIEKDQDYAIAYNNKASLLMENQEYKKAENAIQKALLINPKYAPAFNNRGVLNHNYKRYDDAITDFDKAIVLNRDYAKAYLNRGITKQMTRDENGACLDWIKARELGIMMAKTYLANDCE